MKNIKSLACIAALGITLTSCNDFLTLIPLNDVVLENYWTEKADVESVLLGTYAQLSSQDCLIRMSMWGEMRSDNIVAGSNPPNDILQVTKDNILETNSYTSWSCFYTAINRANTVLHYAPEVAAKDPNYTYNELKSNIAEATALRALAYFYLIRAYKDVPYVTEPSIDDTVNFMKPVSSFDDILDQLIADLEAVKDDAVNKYTVEEANTSRITRCAIYAMLADMYLWRGDYDKVIECCEVVLDRKLYEYEELKREEGNDCLVELYKGIPLIKESTGTVETGTTYNEVFGKGFSFESIFELAFMNYYNDNNFISSYYGNRNTTIGYLSANQELFMNVASGGNSVFTKTDSRYLEDMLESSSTYAIRKYVPLTTSMDLINQSTTNPRATTTERADGINPNWIIYRLSDVMLMEAEAKVMLTKGYDTAASADSIAQRDKLYQEAFKIVVAINNRATGAEENANADTLKYGDYASSFRNMEELVLAERRRELLFEGKRWFDLQRVARRDGNTRRLIQWVITKYTENVSAVRIKLADMDAIYFPYSKDEIKVMDGLLIQNPAYQEDEYISKHE